MATTKKKRTLRGSTGTRVPSKPNTRAQTKPGTRATPKRSQRGIVTTPTRTKPERSAGGGTAPHTSGESEQIPAALGYQMPAEWEAHAATWLAWPHNAEDWPHKHGAIPWVFCEMMRELTRGERVRLLIPAPRRGEQRAPRAGRAVNTQRSEGERAIRAALELAHVDLAQVDFVTANTDRSWTRDSLPQFVVRRPAASKGTRPGSAKASRVAAVKFEFNGWARYDDHKLDDAAGIFVAEQFAERAWFPKVSGRRVVLEGGAIDVDGEGTLLATERCLLGSPYDRNPGLGKAGIESILHDYLGVDKVIWLPDGIAGDDTSGHIDDLARFVAPAKVVLIAEKNRKDENYRALQACKESLLGARDAKGRKLEVIALPMPKAVYFGADRLPASYANFYIANESVLVPTFNDPSDREALGTLAELFPRHRVVGIHALDLVLGLGTLHCSTQQEPLGGM